MILYDTFIGLISLLDSKKTDKTIDKYRIAIDQRNEIDVLVISDNDVLKKDFQSDEIFEDYFNYEKLTNEELEENYFYKSQFQKYGDSIKNVRSSRKKLNNLLDPEISKMPSLPVITFYSYKGGMGRSTQLALTATYLARKHSKKIVIIDCDFEAPGFTNFFLEEPNSRFYNNGVIEYFLDKQFDDTVSLNQYSWEASKEFSGDGEIRIIPAGNLNSTVENNIEFFQTSLDKYLDGLSRFDLSSTNFIVKKFNNLIEDVKNEYNPDAIFIDSRTGFTDVFGITALQLSSQVVGFFNNSVQTEPGLYQFLNSIQDLLTKKQELNPPIIVNSFSKPKLFRDDFKQKCENIINQYQLFACENKEFTDFSLVPFYSYFQYDPTFSDIGTKDEDKIAWLSKLDSGNITGYTDVADKLLESINFQTKLENYPNNELHGNDKNRIQKIESEENFTNLQTNILTKLKAGWPDLYADSGKVNFDEEYENGKFFYRDSMKDIFNFSKFIVLGNKGTGKSYLFQALKENKIVDQLKQLAQKTNLKTNFIHLIDKTNNYFISTNFFESYKKDIEQIGDFYTKFWKVYTWKTITEQIIENTIIDFSPLQVNFSIKADDTENGQNIINFIKNIDNIIAIEKDLLQIDKQLNTKQIDLIAIYDNLDLMVEPYKWESEIAPLINFWSFTAYKKIHCKLFLRSDLFKKIKGINNIQSLENNTINIEWEKEEIFNYFFNLVKRLTKDDFIKVVELFDFKKISDDDILWLKDFKKSFGNTNQKQFQEPILRKLCWVFFGQYPDIKAHGESYDWLYKNVMNADNTISIRPFIELIKLANEKLIKDDKKISELNYGVLPNEYYTDREVRTNCVKKHFQDLVVDKGNEPLDNIFEYIKDHRDFQFFEFLQRDFHQLLNNVRTEYKLNDSIKNLENLLEINGIIRKTPVGNNIKYSFAFLYKYYLGLGSRRKGNRR